MVNLGKDRYSIALNIDLNLVKSRKEKPATSITTFDGMYPNFTIFLMDAEVYHILDGL